MKFKPDMFEAAQCRIMRIEFQLLDLPGKLSEMTGKDCDGKRRSLFTSDDDVDVSKLDGVRTESNSFLPYYKDFCALKERCSFNVQNYGRFAMVSDGYVILEEVERFNVELRGLRRDVSGMLMRKYMTSWQNEHIRRFNPRVKLGMFLLPKFYAEDKSFVDQLAKTFKDELQKGNIDINWILSPSNDSLMRRKTVWMKNGKNELCASYLECQLSEQF